MLSPKPWQEVVKEIQAYRSESIAKANPALPELPIPLPKKVVDIPEQVLSPLEVRITQSSPEAILSAISRGVWTSKVVTQAFLRRACLAQELANCVTEVLPEQALARADELDKYYAEHKRPIGPLHGLPISVKEHVGMKGLNCNAGFVAWAHQVAPDDALILKILWSAGCVFYARTTEPQTLMHLETSSNLYGTTVNPINRDLTSGGSSGGEGALLALRGSCLGIGSDIGNIVIRSPAASNGVYGFRPTSYRLPKSGSFFAENGGDYIAGTLGPISTSLQGIDVSMKTIIDAEPWLLDPSLVPLPWRRYKPDVLASPDERMRIGIMWSDGVVTPHPSVTRALGLMVESLKPLENVDVFDWEPYDHALAWEIIPEWNDTATGKTDAGIPKGSMDVILCPVGPGPAPFLNSSKYWSYTSTWNLLDYPAVVFPVTTFDPAVDRWPQDYEARNDQDQFNHDLCI
ncbi:MAG: hypothetical protein Q9219_003554 [cf. Caloplaca sp. 3 TL-2023]